MHFLLMIFGSFILFSLFVGFVLFCFLFWFVYNLLQKRKRERIARLRSFQKRLKAVLAELLRQVNEIDQISKYSGLDSDPVWSKKYGETLKRLLEASDKLNDAGTFIEMKELNAGQEMLLYVARTVHITNYRMKEIVPEEDFASVQQTVQAQSASASSAQLQDPDETEGDSSLEPGKSADGHDGSQNISINQPENMKE